jgi:hypothetical protein
VRTILHLAWTDARHGRWLIGAWLLLSTLQRLVDDAAPRLAFAIDGLCCQDRVGTAVLILTATRVLVGLVLVAVTVQEMPLLGRRAFLATRPVTLGERAASMLLTLWIRIVVVPAALDAFALNSRGFPPSLVGLDFAEALVGWRLMVVLLLMLAATLTTNVATFLVAIPCAAVTGFAVSAGLLWLIGAPRESAEPLLPIVSQFDAIRLWLTLLVTSATPLLVLLRRRSGAAALLTLAAAWPLMTLANRFPMPFASDDARSAPPAWATERAVVLRFDPTQVAGSRPSPSRPWEPHVYYPVDMPVYLTGVPKGWAAELVRLSSRLTFADGSTMDLRADSHGQLPEAPGRRGRSRFAAWEVLDEREFPFARALAMRLADQPLDERTALTWLGRDNDWDRLGRAPAFDAEAFLAVWRHRVAGTVTLDRARVQMDGAALEIFAIPWKDGSLVLLTRETVVSPLLQPTTTPEYDLRLTATLARSASEIHKPLRGVRWRTRSEGWNWRAESSRWASTRCERYGRYGGSRGRSSRQRAA